MYPFNKNWILVIDLSKKKKNMIYPIKFSVSLLFIFAAWE